MKTTRRIRYTKDGIVGYENGNKVINFGSCTDEKAMNIAEYWVSHRV